MSCIPDVKTTNQMFKYYLKGYSLSGVASIFGVTRQSVYDRFYRRGLKLRSRPDPLPFVIFDGHKYAPGKNGYMRRTKGKRDLLHRAVWRKFKGEIPDGFDIHHIDGNRKNNLISNLECLSKADHTRLYSPHHNQYTKKNQCGSN